MTSEEVLLAACRLAQRWFETSGSSNCGKISRQLGSAIAHAKGNPSTLHLHGTRHARHRIGYGVYDVSGVLVEATQGHGRGIRGAAAATRQPSDHLRSSEAARTGGNV